jgi:FkbM family methyltransferase
VEKMSRARRLIGKATPEPLKEPYRRIQELRQVKQYEALDLWWTLKSGITFTIRSASDWMMFCEIFVDGEYDKPIHRALSANMSSGTLHVLDLGANSGFFTFRMADRAQQAAFAGSIRIVAVEGSPANMRRFETNLQKAGLPAHVQVKTVHGLVGEREGVGHIAEGWCTSHVGQRGVPVPYVDVSRLAEDWPRIDLVKCDIEGSEYDFLRVYADVLHKTCLAVFEFHNPRATRTDGQLSSERIRECRSFLASYGLVHQEVLRTWGPNTVELFWR